MKLYYLLDEYFHINNKKNKSIGEKKVRNINYDEDDFIKYSAKKLLTAELIKLIIFTMHKRIIY